MWNAVAAVLGIVDNITDSLFETEAEKAEARSKVLSALQSVDIAQLQLNTVEAQSRSLFVAGWRPAIGWACAFALVYQFIAHPLLTWVFIWWKIPVPPLPSLDAFLWEIMFGMLGIAGLRSFDKVKGLTK
jgi:hypothetical protein